MSVTVSRKLYGELVKFAFYVVVLSIVVRYLEVEKAFLADRPHRSRQQEEMS